MEEVYPGVTEYMLEPEIPIEIQMEYGYADRCKDDCLIKRSNGVALCTVREFKELYYGKRMTIKEISKFLNVRYTQLRSLMQDHGIRAFSKVHTARRNAYVNTIVNNGIGYKMISVMAPNGTSKRVLEHRAVMEEVLGRQLQHDERVHHIDFDKSNNDPTNLYLCDDKEHGMIHGSTQEVLRLLLSIGIIEFADGRYKINYTSISDKTSYDAKYGAGSHKMWNDFPIRGAESTG